MKKQLFFLAAVTLALASCSSENDVVQTPDVQQTTADGSVGFDVYTQRATRAGEIGTLTTEKLKNGSFQDDGFGVFGYYTNSATYDQQAIPNFFYNQQVTWNGSYFEYEPVKYWPNEYGTTAESEDADKVSFFAYAPYVLVNPSTGKAVNALEPNVFNQEESAELQKWGISSLSHNSATGDPLVKYIASFDQDKCVDLCWGVCDHPTWPRVLDGKAQQINSGKSGLPWLDVERPAEAKTQAEAQQRVKFTFKHATSQLTVKIDAFVDGIDNINAINNTETRVYVRSINFEGFAMKGALNLNNFEAGPSKAYWLDFAGTNDLVTGESITIYDGRKDGKEGTPSGVATNEKSLGLNPALIQSDTWVNHTTDGVTNVEQYLFRKQTASTPEITYASADGPIYVIPTGDDVKVTIVYDIETADKNLATYVSDATQHGSSIENCITKTINFGNTVGMENGKAYTIKLHLGMNSVKFDADVTDWVEADAIPEVDLPANLPVFKAVSTSSSEYENSPEEIWVPAEKTNYQYAISGLNGGETLTSTIAGTNGTSVSSNIANASGIAIVEATLAENMMVTDNKSIRIKAYGNSSLKGKKLAIYQKAHELGLKVNYYDNKHLTFASTATGTTWGADAIKSITVKRNGTELNKVNTLSSPAKDGEYTYTPNGSTGGNVGNITLSTAMSPGDIYSITIQAGDAPEETVTVIIGGLSFASSTVGKAIGDGKFTNPINIYGKGKVAYTSSATSVATIDGETGEVTIVGKGTTTITATLTPDAGTIGSMTETYTLNVGDVVFAPGKEFTYSTSKDRADNEVIIVSGMGATNNMTVGEGDIINGTPTLNVTSGLGTITYTKYTNTLDERTQRITLTSDGKNMTIILSQAKGN